MEWSVVVAVVLRDALAVLRVVTLARAPDVPAQVINRLTAGLQDLLLFTTTEWLVLIWSISAKTLLTPLTEFFSGFPQFLEIRENLVKFSTEVKGREFIKKQRSYIKENQGI